MKRRDFDKVLVGGANGTAAVRMVNERPVQPDSKIIISRRSFLKTSGLAAAAALAWMIDL